MKIAVPSLSPGSQVLTSVSPPAEYGRPAAMSGLDFCGTIDVRAAVNKMGEELFVSATVNATVRMECARCLEQFEMPLTASFEALYAPDSGQGAAAQLSRRTGREDEKVIYYQSGIVDLAEQVIEAALLAAPMKPLCRPDCRGICPTCGKNLNRGSCDCESGRDFNRPFKGLFG